MPNYGQNPYVGSGGGGRYRAPKQLYRKTSGKGRYRMKSMNPLNLALIGAAVVATAVIVLLLMPKGDKAMPAGGKGTTATALANTATTQPTGNVAATETAPAEGSTEPAQTQSAAPTGVASEFFTAGDVQVDYENMLYKSGDLYVKITNVNENDQNYYVADCRAKDSNRLFTAFADDRYAPHHEELSSVMARRKGAVIAINGDYYGSADSGSSDTTHRNDKGIVIRNGALYRQTPWYDVAAIFQDGTMKTYDKSEITPEQLTANGAQQAFSFGPMLMDGNGKALAEDKIKARPPKYNPANPRCGIGYVEPNHFIFIVVDGIRGDYGFGKGMTTTEFAQLFESLGCKCAYNLDGGGSATMVFMGQVVNHPCDNGGNERSVSDIIYFGESETDQTNIERINNR
jgi:exopolysaccharide biosynthesis protein